MVFPEGILVSCALAGLGRPGRLWTQEGEVPVPEAYVAVFDVFFFNLTPRVSGKSATVRSLEIAELDDRHRGFWIALEVACLVDQKSHHLLPVSF